MEKTFILNAQAQSIKNLSFIPSKIFLTLLNLYRDCFVPRNDAPCSFIIAKAFRPKQYKIKALLRKYRDCFTPFAMTHEITIIAREVRPKQSKKLYLISNAKINKAKFFLSAIFVFLCTFLFSQQNIDLTRDNLIIYEKNLNSVSTDFHTALKPYLNTEIEKTDSIIPFTNLFFKKKEFSISTKKIKIDINPLFSVQEGYQLKSSASFLETSIGARLQTSIGNKFSLNANFIGGNSGFVDYIDTNIRHTHVVPGMGTAYESKQGYSYQYYSGYLSYSPNKIFNFQAGRDKHFWGDGYRSLFLSDVVNSYPFFKVSAKIWKLKYTSLFAAFKDVQTPTGLKTNFKNKYGTFHYLSWNVTKRINFGFFESIVWQGSDSTRNRNFDVNYLNPVIFFRPVEYSLGSSDNAFLGCSFKVKLFKKQVFYGQLILDEFYLQEIRSGKGWWANKQGLQLGFKSFDLFSIKNLYLQTELNAVRPYTYSHGSAQQNYGHYAQPLAHPLGANFMESVSFLSYRYRNFIFEGKLMAAVYGADSAGVNFGKDIYQSYASRYSDYGNKINQGLKTNLLLGSFRVAYIIVPKMNLKLEAGFTERVLKSSESTSSTPFIYIGLRTDIMNFYNDF